MKKQMKLCTFLTKPLVLFVLLFALGVGQMWADEITVYTTGEIFIGTGDDAWDNDASTISVDLRYGSPECYDCDGFNGYYNAAMTKTAYTYNGYPIYSYTLDKAAAQFRFKHFKNSVWKENYTADWHSTTGQIYRGYWNNTHHWVTYGRDITIYAVPESMDGSKWTEGNTLKAVFKYGDQDSEKTDKITWTKTDYTYEGNYIYKCTFLVPYNVIKKINFYYNDGTDKDLYEIAWNDATQYGTNDIDGKIFLGWNKNSSGTHTWVTYGRDITIYTVPETLFSDGEKYTTPFSTSTHTLKCNFKYGSSDGEWVSPMPEMTKTAWKYNSATLYKVRMLAKYNVVKQMAFQYFNGGSYINEYLYRNNNADFTDVTAADVDGKIYTGYAESAHHWESYATDITLDKQSGSGGTGSITATVGSAMPAITLPTRVGYAFGGYYSEADGGGTQYYNFDGSSVNNWVKDGPTTLYAKWIAVTLSSPTILASEAAYTGEDITLSLSTTSTYLPEAMVIFYVTDNSVSKTYEVVATPGAIGDAPSYSTTHTATFKTDHPATYSVTAKVFSAKLIDNFDGLSAHWKALGNGSFNASATNPAMQAGNGSNTVMQITRGDDTWKTVQTKKAANDETTTNWNSNYGYIYMSMYSTTARTPKIKYSDDSPGYEKELDANSLSANTWQRKQFATTHDIDYILPFMLADGTMYIDDIILSNESSMTAQATSSSASTTITQPTIGSCTATAATNNWGGSNINISLSAQTTYLADAVVVFFVTDGSNSTTYEVTATPGTPGANNAITHTATFVAQHAATYSVTAKLYNGKFIDNFEGSASAWSGLGFGTCERVSNVEREADNGSTKVMKITRSANDAYGETYQTAWTTTEENSGTKTSWGHEYGYIHMRYYAPQAETPEVEYWDDGSVFKNTTLSSQTASTWHELVFAVNGGVVNYIHPFVLSGGKTDGHYIYIDDIILSNRSTWAPIKNTSDVDLTADASNVTIREDYTVTLDNREATSAGTERVDVTYGATLSAITKPTKTHYDFGGYFTEINGGGSQLIDANGNWIKNVTDYTGASGDNSTWVHADDITLYAKWTEHEYAITINVVGSGTTSPASSTTAKYVTASGDITATPSAGYSFREWGFSETGTGNYDVYVSDGSTYSSTNATIRIKAQRDGTLTANFTPRTYTVRFENLGADKGHTGSLDTTVTFNDTIHMKGRIEVPSKAHYEFGGYYISTDKGATLTNIQIIDANGNWNKNVSGYTGTKDNVATWVCAGDTVLYAKWTETAYTITPSVSPAGAGTVNTVTDAHLITPSSTITATPVNAAWVFDRWEYGEHVGCASGCSTNSVTVTSDMNSTITAHFKPRYELVGCIWDNSGNGGMPGWSYDGTGEFTVNSFTALGTGEGTGVDLSYSCTLWANTTYKFEVHDRVTGNHGKYYAAGQYLNDGEHALLNQKNNDVPLAAIGAGTYTFRITNMTYDGTTDDYFPTITVERPHQMHMGHKRVDIDGTSHSDDTGGTLTASIGGNSLANGDWYNYGANITYTASAQSGYTLTWYTNSDYSSAFSPQPEASWPHNNVTGDENVYAKFTEKSTAVTFSATNGKVQIASTDKANTTVGITTHREITAVPNTGYSFSSWSVPGGADFSVGSTSSATTTLSGLGTGTAGTLTANFTENIYAITISADATGGGTVSTTSVSAGIDTNPEITATPTNAAWHFKQWNCTGGASVASETSATTTVSASATGTVTAVFEPRYVLVGSLNEGGDPSGGMPSWDYSLSTGNFIVNSFTAPKVGDANITVDLSCACTLNPNKQYKFAVHDRKEGKNLGYITDNSVLPSGSSFLCNTQDRTILLNTVGAGTYTFQISQLTNDANNYPTVSVDRPTSYQSNFGWKYADGSGTLHSGDNGGTITVTASDGGSHTISSGQWVAAGANITYTASPATGYAFVGWHTDDTYVTWFSNDNPWTNSDIKAASNAYAKFVPVAVTFTNNSGSGDGKWSTASNWSPACVPTIDHDVVITKPVTVDIDHATAKSIVLDQNSKTGKLTIDANQGLEVVGTITRTTNGEDRLATRAEDLILESDETGNASLVFTNSNSCAATVKMYSIGEIVSESQWNWQFMGTPFTSANALYSYYGSYLYEWKSSGDWDVVPNGGTMTPFTGYCITQSSPTTYVMDGTLNPNSDVNISIPAGKEFVMANSWTAPISVCNFTNTTLPLTTKTIYLFNTGFAPKESGDAEQGTAAGTYIAMPINSAIYTGNYLIAPMEGFYVDNRGHDAATITLKYNELVRPQVSRDIVAGAMHAPKRAVAAENEPAVMKIKATGSRYSERIVILEREDFSAGFDNGWDGKNLNEPGVAPILYALREDGTKDAVSAIPTYEGTVVGFRQGEDNQYTFSFNYDGEDTWYLNDLQTETSTLIDAANTYSFVAEAGDAEARFIISATPIQKLPTGIGNDANDAMAKVRKLIINDQLFIIRAGRMYNAVGSIVK